MQTTHLREALHAIVADDVKRLGRMAYSTYTLLEQRGFYHTEICEMERRHLDNTETAQ